MELVHGSSEAPSHPQSLIHVNENVGDPQAGVEGEKDVCVEASRRAVGQDGEGDRSSPEDCERTEGGVIGERTLSNEVEAAAASFDDGMRVSTSFRNS